MSALLRECGHEVIVANPQRLRLLTTSDKKNDPQDARTLAEMAWAKPALLAPVRHRSAEAQRDLNLVRARDLLVEARTKLINGVRCLVKGFGGRIPKCASWQFSQQAHTHLPEEARPATAPLLEMIDELSERIYEYDAVLEHIAETRYPQAALLTQISGVGTLSAITFVLTIEDPHRFARSRDVGSFLGLRPKQQDSGDRSPQLRITKAGDQYLRKMLVSCAHYVIGPFGPDTDLRRWGLKLCERGGKNAKKRAVVAVARKLAVLLHRLWVTAEVYEPLRNPPKQRSRRNFYYFPEGRERMARITKRRVWMTAIGVWVPYETAAKKAASKTTRNPNVHRTPTVHQSADGSRAGCPARASDRAEGKTKTFLR